MNDQLNDLHKKVRTTEIRRQKYSGSTKFINLSEAFEVLGDFESIARYCHVNKRFLESRIDRKKGVIYDPIAGCISAGFSHVTLYVRGDRGNLVPYRKTR